MEVVLGQTYQTIRRAGKRFVVSKVNATGASNKQQQHSPQQIEQHQQVFKFTGEIYDNYVVSTPSAIKYPMRFKEVFIAKDAQTLNISRRTKLVIPQKYSLFSRSVCCLHTISKVSLLNLSEVEETLEKNQISYKKGFTGFLARCNKCSPSDQSTYDIFIDSRTGQTTCRACGLKCDWKKFIEIYGRNNEGIKFVEETPIVFLSEPPEYNTVWKDSHLINHNNQLNAPFDHLSIEVLQNYNVRITEAGNIVFPYYDITKTKLLELKVYDSHGHDELMNISNDVSAVFFGWHTIQENCKRVIITSSELDCLAVFQATGVSALALCKNSVAPDIFPFLEQFDEIILWFRDEYRERENLQNFAKKLNLQRCRKVTCSYNSLSVLQNSGVKAIIDVVNDAYKMSHDNILTFKDLRTELYAELINTKKNAGVPFTRFPVLNEYLKGHRRGELTVFTGPTGSGKTTFLSELSLDLCIQGVKTLWGSFEIKNLRLLNTLMHQYSGFALENHMNEFLTWSEQFENLPLYFMNYYGAHDLKDVIKTIEYAIYTHDIEHIVIDNLQFMTSTLGHGDDKFQVMDKAISAFRRCASDHNVHVTVVVHPRKENDGGSLQTSSIYGSAKASQEADNVLILQTSDQLSMQVTKNRFSGSIGMLPLSFHSDSLCLSGFHRNVETGEEILPHLRVRRPVRNVQILRKNKE